MINPFSIMRYENKLRKIKEENFERVSDLEDGVHHLKIEKDTLERKLKHDVEDVEHNYKLKVVGIVTTHEKELQALNHTLILEREKFSVERERTTLQHENELRQRLHDAEMSITEKLQSLIEREGIAKDNVLNTHLEVIKILKDSIPQLNWSRKEGVPEVVIEDRRNDKKDV